MRSKSTHIRTHSMMETKNDKEHKHPSLKLYTFNVRGLRNNHRRSKLLKYIDNNCKGIVYLQETHSTEECENTWQNEIKGQIFMSHGTEHSKGVMIIILCVLDFQVTKISKSPNGRFIFIDGLLDKKPLSLLNTYAAMKDKLKEQLDFLNEITPIIQEYSSRLLWGGDLNTYMNIDYDKKGGSAEKESMYAKRIMEITDEYELCDVYRVLNPDTKRYTWRQNTVAGIVQARLDYWLIPNGMFYDIAKSQIQNSICSDHNIVMIELILTDEPVKGRGSWKFNNSLLEDSEYVKKIHEYLNTGQDELKGMDPRLKWDFIKMKIRGITLSHSAYKAIKKP